MESRGRAKRQSHLNPEGEGTIGGGRERSSPLLCSLGLLSDPTLPLGSRRSGRPVPRHGRIEPFGSSPSTPRAGEGPHGLHLDCGRPATGGRDGDQEWGDRDVEGDRLLPPSASGRSLSRGVVGCGGRAGAVYDPEGSWDKCGASYLSTRSPGRPNPPFVVTPRWHGRDPPPTNLATLGAIPPDPTGWIPVLGGGGRGRGTGVVTLTGLRRPLVLRLPDGLVAPGPWWK